MQGNALDHCLLILQLRRANIKVFKVIAKALSGTVLLKIPIRFLAFKNTT